MYIIVLIYTTNQIGASLAVCVMEAVRGDEHQYIHIYIYISIDQ